MIFLARPKGDLLGMTYDSYFVDGRLITLPKNFIWKTMRLELFILLFYDSQYFVAISSSHQPAFERVVFKYT